MIFVSILIFYRTFKSHDDKDDEGARHPKLRHDSTCGPQLPALVEQLTHVFNEDESEEESEDAG